MSVIVYAHDNVREVQELYRDAPIIGCKTTKEVVETHAEILFSAYAADNPIACLQIRHWHPRLISKPVEEVFAADFTIDDARLTLSRELGFTDWDDALTRSASIDPEFENCVDLVLAGNLASLKDAVKDNAELVTQQSSFGHRATLLLYLAANGVETIRQVVPSNATEVASLLLASGSDPKAKMLVYDGEFDVVPLIESSAHPHRAGVADALVKVIRSQ